MMEKRMVKKVKLYGYRSLIFLLLFLAGVCLIQFLQKESWYLLWIDVMSKFEDNKAFIRGFFVLIVLMCCWIVWSYLGISGKIRIAWKIRIGKHIWYYYNCKYLNKIYLTVVIVAVVLICCIVGWAGKDFFRIKGNLWDGSVVIGHSFGEIEGHIYTGTLEAFQNNYQKGLRVFEVDFDITSDDKVVLRHDWNQKLQEGVSADHPPTQEEFLKIPILGKYTPLSFEDLCMIMKEYPDIWIVTDSKYKEPELVKKQFGIMKDTAEQIDGGCSEIFDRLIVQIYNEEMYEALEEVYPFKSYIFTMYQRWFGGEEEYIELCRWSAEHNIPVITMGWDLVNKDILEISNRYHLDIYVNTINKVEEAKRLLKDGVRGVYTDKLRPLDLEEN